MGEVRGVKVGEVRGVKWGKRGELGT
jgi:hypothetical protein